MQAKRIYLDYAATSPILPEVIDYISEIAKTIFGNPSSTHAEGRIAKSFLEEHRKTISSLLKCNSSELFFTSCGTESNNLILKSSVSTLGVKRIISSPIEHSCNLQCFKWLQKEYKTQVDFLKVNEFGQIDLEELESLLHDNSQKTLVSLMHVNNELGTLLNLEETGHICRKHHALFHTDTVQGIGFFPYNFSELPIDFASGSAHKFYAPKSCGFAYINNQNILEPLLHGGSQERSVRAGTENLIGIGAMSKALSYCYSDLENRMTHLEQLNLQLRSLLSKQFPDILINSPWHASSPKILNVQFPYFEGIELLTIKLDIEGLSVSGGSACASGAETASHVISQIRPDHPGKAIRFSFSHLTNSEEIERCVSILAKVIH